MTAHTLFERIRYRVDASWVRRFHTHSVINYETLGQHSHTVAMLVSQVYPQCTKQLLLTALEHDLPEFFTGDVPAPAKWASQAVKYSLTDLEREVVTEWGLESEEALTSFDKMLLKWADMMSLVLFCIKEVSMGNSTMYQTMHTGLELCAQRAQAMALVQNKWDTYCQTSITGMIDLTQQIKSTVNKEFPYDR